MEKDIIMMKLSDIIQFIEEVTGEKNITQLELTPIPFADEHLYLTGFRMDTPTPLIHIKSIKKLKLFSTNPATPQQVEYYMMNPDADIWIDFDALDSLNLKATIDELKKKVFKSTGLDVLHLSYRDKDTQQEITRNIAYDSRRVACKDAMSLRATHNGLHFHFSKAINKEHKMTDLEFATAAL